MSNPMEEVKVKKFFPDQIEAGTGSIDEPTIDLPNEKLRKSIHSILTMPLYQLEALLQHETISLPITEKTDGFSFEIGYDSDGFWARSATSEKMRKVGCFSKVAAKKFAGREDYDPMIALRLDFAHHTLRRCRTLYDFVRSERTSIAGEMIMVIDENVFSPNNTYFYPPNFGTFGTFVIHTRKPANYHISALDIKNLTDSRDHTFLRIDHDVPETSRVRINFADLHEHYQKIKEERIHVHTLRQRLNDRFAAHLPQKSKWSSGKPEGFIVHLGDSCFKVMIEKKPESVQGITSSYELPNMVLPISYFDESEK